MPSRDHRYSKSLHTNCAAYETKRNSTRKCFITRYCGGTLKQCFSTSRKCSEIISHLSTLTICICLCFSNRLKHFYILKSVLYAAVLPLLEKGKADADGHVVDTKRNGISFIRTILGEQKQPVAAYTQSLAFRIK